MRDKNKSDITGKKYKGDTTASLCFLTLRIRISGGRFVYPRWMQDVPRDEKNKVRFPELEKACCGSLLFGY